MPTGYPVAAPSTALVRLVFTDAAEERARAVARWLSHLYGSGNLDTRPAVAPLEPDLLAEVLVASVLATRPELVAAALDVTSNTQLARARRAGPRGGTRAPSRDHPPAR